MSERVVATGYAGGSAVSLGEFLGPMRQLANEHGRDLTGETRAALRAWVEQAERERAVPRTFEKE
jgi:hypothetical protein